MEKIEDAQKTITSMIEKQQIPQDVLKQVDTYSAQLQDTLVNLLKNGIPHLLTMASGFASSLANVFMALVIAVYLTVSKDKLLEQSHRFLYAFTSSRANAFVLRVAHGICLQQFESNLIYPRVVGTSVGLSGLWVLFAITVGGGLFGFAGMLLGLPTFSVIYSLLREEMNRRVRLKRENSSVELPVSEDLPEQSEDMI